MNTKILKYTTIVIISMITISFLISWKYGEKLKQIVITEVNKGINAELQIEDASISIFRKFPSVQLQLQGVKIIGKNEFSLDTLANIKQLNLAISVWEYLKNDKIQVQSLQVQQAKIHIKVLQNKKANWDIAKSDSNKTESSESKSPINLSIQSYSIESSEIFYEDLSRNFITHLIDLNHEGSGDFSKAIFTLETSTEVGKWDMEFLGKPILSRAKATLKAPISMNLQTNTFTFNDNTLLINELPIRFTYKMAMPDSTIDMDLRFQSDQTNLKNFLSLIPALYSQKFESLQTSGNAILNGFVKGTLTENKIPGFEINFKVNQGAFSYTGQPEKIHEANLGLTIVNKSGNVEETSISLQPFNFKVNQESIQSHVLIENPTGDPLLLGGIQGKIHLENIAKLFPKEGLSYAGLMDVALNFQGKLSSLKTGNGKVIGKASIQQFKGTFDNKRLEIPLITGQFSPKSLDIQSNFTYLNSPISVKGVVENIFGFFMKGESISSNLFINIQHMNIQKAFQNFQLVQQYLPIAGNLTGNISPNFTFEGNFDKDFNLDLATVQAEGHLLTSEINASSSQILKKIMQVAKWKGSQELNIQPADLNFKIADGRLQFKPFDLQTKLGQLSVSGSNGLDKTLNYEIKTSLDAQKIDSGLAEKLNQQIQKVSKQVSAGQLLAKIPLQILVSGNIEKPDVRVSLTGASGKSNQEVKKEAVKDVVKTEIKAQKNKALEEAQKKADAEMERARALAADLKSKAYAEADKLVEQAGNPLAKFAAQKLADRLKKEADKKVEKILEDAQNRANDLIEKAKTLE